MRIRRIFTMTVVLLALIIISTTTAAAISCACGDICVNESGWWRDNGSFNASTTPMQAAADNANAGETICVAAGSYTENVNIATPHLTLAGEGAGVVNVTANSSSDHVFNVTADYVNISGFNVTGATGSDKAGIYLNGTDHCNISESAASDNYYGICLLSSSNNTLANNNASSNNNYGIWLDYSSNNTLTGNTARSNNYYGIRLYESSDNTLTSNTASSNNYYGIYLEDSSDNTLANNTASNNNYGIWLDYSSNNTLTSNNCSNNDYGIRLHSSSNNTLTSNTASDNSWDGIRLYSSSNNNLSDNFVAHHNTHSGIALGSSSNYNNFTGNNFSNNNYGIYIGSSSNNRIYNNYFNNTNNARDDGNNNWNITRTAGTNIIVGPYLGGNYWSDYTGFDTDGDGLGNTMLPYNSSGSIQNGGDYHPLVPAAPEPTYVPPNPENLQNTTSNYWVNYTWTAGTGVLTDGYNVSTDDGWYNRTETSLNSDVGAGNWSNITVWAWNKTGDGNMSATNVSDSVQASAASTSCTCGDICVNQSGWWRDGGTLNVSTIPIQAAVDNATAGDVICVAAGSYSENVDIATSNLTLRGEGAGVVTVTAASSSDHVFDVSVSYVNISGFNVSGATKYTKAGIYLGSNVDYCNISYNTADSNNRGIRLYSSSNNTLTSNNCSNNYYGIRLYESSDNTLTSNTASSNNYYGIYLEDSSDNTLANNTASNNNYGIWLDYSSNNTLANNTASSNNNYGIYLCSSSNNTLANNTASSNNYNGIYLYYSSNNTLTGNTMSGNMHNFGVYGSSPSEYIQSIDTSNTVDGKPIYYWVDPKDKQIPSDAGFVGVVNGTNITVRDLRLTNNSHGVLFANTRNSRIGNVTASSNDCGIQLKYSSNYNTLTGNTVSDNHGNGVCLCSSSNNTLESNTANLNSKRGIHLYYSNNNTLESNTANLNDNRGIWLKESCDHNTLTNNTANLNAHCGIQLKYSSNYNTLVNNTAISNDYDGIRLAESSNDNTLANNTASNNEYGIHLCSSDSNTLTNNTASNNEYGIHLCSSDSNTLTNNTASNNEYGIHLCSSDSNTLTSNTASSNDYGIRLYSSSNNNTLTGNNCSNNTQWDLCIRGSDCTFTNNTLNGTTVSFTYSGDVSLKGVGSPAADPAGQQTIGKFINATNQSAGAWLFLNFSYSEADVSGLVESDLKVWKHNGTVWLEDGWNGTRYLDTTGNVVGANITSFSVFAPAASTMAGSYVPPDPTNLANTTSNYWVNYTWSVGTSNVTDSYNVSLNGTWTNGTTNTFANMNVGPSG
ncbi:MAG: right-handed parallel beta-helix repeat-containing protein, partial [Methanosarcinales archaeon]|nr:right-handed parallel beta-helix repeat-containing protein [Methanosarcinales archaeon]